MAYKSVKDIIDDMTEEQQAAAYAIIDAYYNEYGDVNATAKTVNTKASRAKLEHSKKTKKLLDSNIDDVKKKK